MSDYYYFVVFTDVFSKLCLLSSFGQFIRFKNFFKAFECACDIHDKKACDVFVYRSNVSCPEQFVFDDSWIIALLWPYGVIAK